MAGVTNNPYRTLCSRYGAALYVSEMLHASLLTASKVASTKSRFGRSEAPRSAQLLGHDPVEMRTAAELLITRESVQHIDLNFGCPVRKVVRKGGGSSIPANLPLLARIVRAVVSVADEYNVPVTAKMRLGAQDGHYTYLDAGRVVQEQGGKALILHARTVKQGYGGNAREKWGCIRELVRQLQIPVIGNGDIFTAGDALDMVRYTGCAGIAVGRGCLGRPWLFRDLADAFRTGVAVTTVPGFAEVREILMEHLVLQVDWCGALGVCEREAIVSMRRFFGWYLKGYEGLPDGLVRRLCVVETVAEVAQLLFRVDADCVSARVDLITGARGKTGDGGG